MASAGCQPGNGAKACFFRQRHSMAGQPDCRLLIFRTAGLAPNKSYQTIGLQQIPAARRELCIAEVEAPVNMPLDEPSRPDDIRWALRKRAVWSERNSSLFGLGNFLFFTLYPDPTHLPIRLFDANPHFPMLGSVPFHDLMPRANPVGCPVRAVPVTHSAPRTVRPRMAELFVFCDRIFDWRIFAIVPSKPLQFLPHPHFGLCDEAAKRAAVEAGQRFAIAH